MRGRKFFTNYKLVMNPVRGRGRLAKYSNKKNMSEQDLKGDRITKVCDPRPASNGMNYIFAILFLVFSFSTPVFSAEETPLKNAGFVQGNIWYSKTPFFAGEKIRIYTIIFNGSTEDLTGSVEFLDNGTPIGKSPFSISGGGRVRDVWVDWIAKDGKHTVTAQIIDINSIDALGKKKIVELENRETGKSELLVDSDTDSDGVGNADDIDDDNDNVSDIDEVRNGTDPLKKDTYENRILDDKELKLTTKKSSTATSTGVLAAIEGAIKMANDAIPDVVKASVASSTNAIERFRAGEGYQFRLAKEAKIKEIAAIKEVEQFRMASGTTKTIASGTGSILNVTEKPFAYVMLAILTFLQYLFDWRILFYGVVLYVVYRFFRWIIRLIRDR